MPKPRKGWSLEECQGMCQDDNCSAWQWWPVEGGCRWFTGKVSSEEKEGHPSVGGTKDCDASDLRYDGVLIPHAPYLASDDLPSDPFTQACSTADTDRYYPDLSACCNGLTECVEDRPKNNSAYCAASDPGHGITCWSQIVMCRTTCQPRQGCSAAGTERYFPDMGGCCSGLSELLKSGQQTTVVICSE